MEQELGQGHNTGLVDSEVVSRSTARILIVDDEPDAIRLLETLLHSEGYAHLLGTTDSREVVRLFQEFQPDLVLLDLMLPHLDGFQLLGQLSALIPSATFVPLVAITALSDAVSKTRALQLGAHDFITKPFLPDEVLLRIRTLLQLRDLNLHLRQHNRDLALFGAIVDSSQDAIISKTMESIITSWNPGAEKLFGYQASEAIGQSILMLFPPDRREEEAYILEQQVQGQRIDHFETVRVRKDGQHINVSLTLSPIVDGQRNVIGVSKIARDITERKRAEEEREELLDREQCARREAEQANLAKSEFLSRMSHELRTPLNAILGFAQVLKLSLKTERDREAVEEILNGGNHLLGLVNQVLDITRIEDGDLTISLEQVSVSTLVQEAMSLVGPLASQGHLNHVHLHAVGDEESGGNCYVLADEPRLKQVLISLLSNAIKYNRVNGNVYLACEVVPEEQLRIEVRDDGPGIEPSQLEKLFVPFERLGAAAGAIDGTGLGLALCRGLIEAMGGRIGLDSVVGEGTTAWVELPLACVPEAQAQQPTNDTDLGGTGADSPEATPRTILLIEDNPSNQRLIECFFENQPRIRLLPARQGSQGLELAQQHHPDLILLDLHLPDIDGREVLGQLKANSLTAAIPVVVVSADATYQQAELLKAAGAKAYLTKPLNLDEFSQTVESLL